jgi:beta-phosphoglucomutase family hydrolase
MKPDFAVIFDMDGVIVDNFSYHEKSWAKFCNSHNLEFNESFRNKVFGTTNKNHLETFFCRELSEEEIRRHEKEKEQIYRDIYKDEIKPVKGLLDFLEELTKNKIPIALATSSPPVNVKFVLENTQTKKYFNNILDASNVEKGKPDPEIYRKAGELLNKPPENCFVIEDSTKGIESAKRAGMKVIGITTTQTADELENIDLLIQSFEELNIEKLINLI